MNNNTRYIVFIQTKYHQNILPVNDVSPQSLEMLLKSIWSYRWYSFRSIRIYKDDITTIKVYEMNFLNYKKNVLEKSDFWKKLYIKFSFISWLLDIILYLFIYKLEINKFWNTITNKKPKYLIDKTKDFLDVLYWKDKEFNIDKDWKEIIEQIDFHNWKLYINEKFFELDEKLKASYFLDLIARYFSKHEENYFVELWEFINYHENQYYKDWKDYKYLNLNEDNIKKWYIKTINDNILKKYNKEILEIKRNFIRIVL